MRNWFLLAAVSVFATTALAQVQVTPGLSIDTIIHEPNADEVGPFIANTMVNNPNYDPTQPTGEPQMITVYGNGNGYDNELDSVSDEFYAIGGTTTHELAILTNNTGADIVVNADVMVANPNPPLSGSTLLVTSRADTTVTTEQPSPDGGSQAPTNIMPFYFVDAATVSVPNGSSVALFLLITQWSQNLDTSPRNYIYTFIFEDLNGGGQGGVMAVEADLWVPTVGGSEGSSCVSSPDGPPTGLLLLATGAMAAYVYRRKKVKKIAA